jgi:hypothetical protein
VIHRIDSSDKERAIGDARIRDEDRGVLERKEAVRGLAPHERAVENGEVAPSMKVPLGHNVGEVQIAEDIAVIARARRQPDADDRRQKLRNTKEG